MSVTLVLGIVPCWLSRGRYHLVTGQLDHNVQALVRWSLMAEMVQAELRQEKARIDMAEQVVEAV